MVAITTFDNPYDPFEDFDSWYAFDMQHGYDSCGLLARIARTNDAFSEEENAAEIERAINTIIINDFLHLYKKVKKET